jgi:RNA recognition motif-containing protein
VLFDRSTGKSRQIGFVRFKDVKDAEVAMQLMSGYRTDPQAVPWSVRFVESEEEKKGWSFLEVKLMYFQRERKGYMRRNRKSLKNLNDIIPCCRVKV